MEASEASACNFTKSSTPPWVFFTFFKLYKWYQIAQHITNEMACLIPCVEVTVYPALLGVNHNIKKKKQFSENLLFQKFIKHRNLVKSDL